MNSLKSFLGIDSALEQPLFGHLLLHDLEDMMVRVEEWVVPNGLFHILLTDETGEHHGQGGTSADPGHAVEDDFFRSTMFLEELDHLLGVSLVEQDMHRVCRRGSVVVESKHEFVRVRPHQRRDVPTLVEDANDDRIFVSRLVRECILTTQDVNVFHEGSNRLSRGRVHLNLPFNYCYFNYTKK